MCEENIIQKFKLKNIDETRNYLIKEINENELMSKKHQKIYRDLIYVEHLLILFSTVTGCISISSFASSVSIPGGITSFTIELKIYVIAAGIKKYKSIINKKKKKHDQKLSLAKPKLNSVEFLISKALIDSNISHNEFILMKMCWKNSMISRKHCVKSIQILNFFCSIFSCIWTECEDLLRKYPPPVQIRENKDQKNSVFRHFSHSEKIKTSNDK